MGATVNEGEQRWSENEMWVRQCVVCKGGVSEVWVRQRVRVSRIGKSEMWM